jgi:Predicted transcriptional regulators
MDATKTGAYLAALRKGRGMTQQEAAEALNLSNKTISKWESGGGFPDITVLPALSELYGVTADEILAGQPLSRADAAAERTAVRERRSYLLSRAEMRYSICAGAAAIAAMAGLLYENYLTAALILLLCSVLALWAGVQLAFPVLRAAEEGRAKAALRWYRLMLVPAALQLRLTLWLVTLWNGMVYQLFSETLSAYLVNTIQMSRMLNFAAVLLLPPLCLLLQSRLRRTAGETMRLIPAPVFVILTALCLSLPAAEFLRYHAELPWQLKMWDALTEYKRSLALQKRTAAGAPYLLAEKLLAGAGACGICLTAVVRRRKA